MEKYIFILFTITPVNSLSFAGEKCSLMRGHSHFGQYVIECLYYYVFNGYLPKSRVEQKCMRGERPPKRGGEARSRTLVPGTHIAADDREIRNTRDELRSIYR